MIFDKIKIYILKCIIYFLIIIDKYTILFYIIININSQFFIFFLCPIQNITSLSSVVLYVKPHLESGSLSGGSRAWVGIPFIWAAVVEDFHVRSRGRRRATLS